MRGFFTVYTLHGADFKSFGKFEVCLSATFFGSLSDGFCLHNFSVGFAKHMHFNKNYRVLRLHNVPHFSLLPFPSSLCHLFDVNSFVRRQSMS